MEGGDWRQGWCSPQQHHAQASRATGERIQSLRTKQATRAAMSSGATQYPRTQSAWKKELGASARQNGGGSRTGRDVHAAAEKLQKDGPFSSQPRRRWEGTYFGLDSDDEGADGDDDDDAGEHAEFLRGGSLQGGWSGAGCKGRVCD